MRFIDIHSHILPEIDDGAVDIAEALKMLEEAQDAGVKEIVLTPHMSVEDGSAVRDRIAGQFASLKAIVLERGLTVKLHLGAELRIHPDLPDLVRQDKSLTINGRGKHILIEMPLPHIPVYAPKVVFELLAQNITPVWAHPERCGDIMRDSSILLDYKDKGVLFQLNSGSLLGHYGWRIKFLTKKLIRNDCVHFMASDAHHPGQVKERLPPAFARLVKLAGEKKAEAAFYSSASQLVR